MIELKSHILDDMFSTTKVGHLALRLPAKSLAAQEGATVALRITSGELDGVTVVWLDGSIALGEESGALRETVKSLMAQGKKKLILNMNNITWIDSAGLGALVAAYSSTKSGGASLRLCHLGTKFNELLQITKLMTLFEVYGTQAEAMSSFSK